MKELGFWYCSYWGTWSRKWQTANGDFVELNLVGIGFRCEEKDKQEVIRFHCTQPDKNDRLVSVLPADVRAKMEAFYGATQTYRMLYHKYNFNESLLRSQMVGGGVPYHFVRGDE